MRQPGPAAAEVTARLQLHACFIRVDLTKTRQRSFGVTRQPKLGGGGPLAGGCDLDTKGRSSLSYHHDPTSNQEPLEQTTKRRLQRGTSR